MRVFPLYITVFFIAKAAIAHGFQDSSAKDVARQEHPRRQREDFVRSYPNFRRKNDLKWRNYHLSPPNEVSLSRADIARLRTFADRSRHSSRKKKFSPTTEGGYFESDPRKPDENASTSRQDESEATPTGGETGAKPDGPAVVSDSPIIRVNKENAVLNIANELPAKTIASHAHHHSRLSKPVDRSVVSYSKMHPIESCPDCPTSLESMLICQKCRTHYTVRINIKESKCSHCADDPPPCCSESVGNDLGQRTDENRGKRDGARSPKTKKSCSCIGPCSCSKLQGDALSTFDQPNSIPECPSSIENVFQCPKCRTHYIVRINAKESKCCHCGGDPPCGSEGKRVSNDARKKFLNTRCKREDRTPRLNTNKISSCDPPILYPECPNNVENMFQCPKCRTHYIVKINIRESKCCHCAGTAPPCAQKKQRRRKQNRGEP